MYLHVSTLSPYHLTVILEYLSNCFTIADGTVKSIGIPCNQHYNSRTTNNIYKLQGI